MIWNNINGIAKTLLLHQKRELLRSVVYDEYMNFYIYYITTAINISNVIF